MVQTPKPKLMMLRFVMSSSSSLLRILLSIPLQPPQQRNPWLLLRKFRARTLLVPQREVLSTCRKNPATVVDGPPGTGKSQVIVNLVADALRYCLLRGYLELSNGRYRVHWAFFRAISDFLVRRHLVIEVGKP